MIDEFSSMGDRCFMPPPPFAAFTDRGRRETGLGDLERGEGGGENEWGCSE